jgi:hypothetical protein
MAENEIADGGTGMARGNGWGTETRPSPPEAESPRDRRTPVALVLLLLAALAMLALAVWIVAPARDGDSSDFSRRIESLADKKSVPRLVSVWTEPGMDIEFALSRAGIRCENTTLVGDSCYVVCVEAGEEDSAVRSLKRVRGIYDVGLVYEEPGGIVDSRAPTRP